MEKKTVVILGDSIVKNVQGWKLPNNSSSKSLVKAFPGAKVDDMLHYVKPMLIHHPDEIIIHVGTNDVKHSSPKTIAEHITDLVNVLSPTLLKLRYHFLVYYVDLMTIL